MQENTDAKEAGMASGTEALVCAMIARRQQLGIAKYGTTVAQNPLTMREWMQHALEEALDFSVYLARAIEQMDKAQDGENRRARPICTATPFVYSPRPEVPHHVPQPADQERSEREQVYKWTPESQ